MHSQMMGKHTNMKLITTHGSKIVNNLNSMLRIFSKGDPTLVKIQDNTEVGIKVFFSMIKKK